MIRIVSTKTLATAIAFVAVLAVTSAYGQSGVSRVNIPFEFRVGEHMLPAGKYVVEVNEAYRRILLRDQDSGDGMWLPVQRAYRGASDDSGRLVFHRYGNTYFLREVWKGGSQSGFATPASRAEREMVKANTPREVQNLETGAH